jgi:hypothetical protein
MQPRLHGARAAANDFGYLLDGHILQEAEREHSAMIDGQAKQRGVDQLRIFKRGAILKGWVERLRRGDVFELDGPFGFLPQLRDRLVMSDPIQPDAKGRRRLQFPQAPMNDQPDYLEDVERFIGFAENPADEVKQPPVVQIHKIPERLPITLLSAQDREPLFKLLAIADHWHRLDVSNSSVPLYSVVLRTRLVQFVPAFEENR